MSSNLLSDLRDKANELQEADRLYREAFPGYDPEPKDSLIPFATLLHDAANALERAEAEVERLRAIIEANLHERRCWPCGTVFWAKAAITPYCLCPNCNSQDTRRTKRAQAKD